MKKVNGLWMGAAVLSAGLGLLALGSNNALAAPKVSAPAPAAATATPRPTPVPVKPASAAVATTAWGLQVASVNGIPDIQSVAFQETFKLINFSPVPQDASKVFVALYFDVAQGDPNQVSFVNSTYASVFNPNGTPTGVNSSVVQEGVGLFGPCLNPVTHQLITSDFGFSVQPGTMVPANGGYLTFTPELWRNGQYPFNNNNNWTAQNGGSGFHFDPHVDLVYAGLGNVTDASVYSAPGVQETVLNRCSNQPESSTNVDPLP
jgi:hypothetical protein